MFCSRCGHANIDGAAFCQHCGAPVGAQQPPVYNTQPPTPAPSYQPGVPAQAAPVYQPGVPVQAAPVYQPMPPQAIGHPVIETVRSLILSPLFLVAVILFSASILLSVLGSFGLTEAMTGWMTDVFYEFGMEAELDEITQTLMTDSMGVGTVVGALFGSIPSVLMALGMWMLYTSARNRQNLLINTGGLTLIKVLTIISLVSLGLVSALLLLMLVIVWIVASGEMIADEALILSVGMIVVLVFLAVVLTLCILYYVKVIKTVGTIQKTLQTGVPSDRVSMFLIVMLFITGGNAVMSSFSLVLFGGSGLALMVASVAQGVASILFGVLLLQYRSRMRELLTMVPPAAVPYGVPQQYYGAPVEPVPPTEVASVDEIPAEDRVE